MNHSIKKIIFFFSLAPHVFVLIYHGWQKMQWSFLRLHSITKICAVECINLRQTEVVHWLTNRRKNHIWLVSEKLGIHGTQVSKHRICTSVVNNKRRVPWILFHSPNCSLYCIHLSWMMDGKPFRFFQLGLECNWL